MEINKQRETLAAEFRVGIKARFEALATALGPELHGYLGTEHQAEFP